MMQTYPLMESNNRPCVTTAGRALRELNMDTNTLLIIVLILILLGGGGWYGRGRWY
jgi:hypothetical protein